MRSRHTAFVVVTRADPGEVDKTLAFNAALESYEVDPAVYIANRLTPAPGPEREVKLGTRMMDAPRGTAKKVEAMEASLDRARKREAQALAELRSILEAKGTAVLGVQSLPRDIDCLEDIRSLAARLAGNPEASAKRGGS